MEKFNVKSSSQQMPSFLQAIGAVAPRQSSGSNQRSGLLSVLWYLQIKILTGQSLQLGYVMNINPFLVMTTTVC